MWTIVETIVVVVIVALAFTYLVLRTRNQISSKQAGGCSCQCDCPATCQASSCDRELCGRPGTGAPESDTDARFNFEEEDPAFHKTG